LSLRDQLPYLLAQKTGFYQLPALFNAFVIFAISSSLIGVSVSLFDFVKDWLNQYHYSQLFVALIAFLPPVLLVLLYPDLFIMALRPAGILVAVLLMILPVLSCMGLRVKRKTGVYRMRYFKVLAVFVLLSAGFMIVLDLMRLIGR
jgi:tyrosine-specific transport protein